MEPRRRKSRPDPRGTRVDCGFPDEPRSDHRPRLPDRPRGRPCAIGARGHRVRPVAREGGGTMLRRRLPLWRRLRLRRRRGARCPARRDACAARALARRSHARRHSPFRGRRLRDACEPRRSRRLHPRRLDPRGTARVQASARARLAVDHLTRGPRVGVFVNLKHSCRLAPCARRLPRGPSCPHRSPRLCAPSAS
jgi:hypothetical protein